MKIVQVRFGAGKELNDFGHSDAYRASDRFVTETEAEEIIRVYGSAKVIDRREVDITLANEFDPDAPLFKWDAFERAVILRVAQPKEPAKGYPKMTRTVLVNGKPHNIQFKIMPATNPYDWPVWAIVQSAIAMFDSPKSGVSQLKAAVRAYEEK